MTERPAPSIERQAMPYRDCVGIALFNPVGQVFVGRRIYDGGNDRSEVTAPWQLPQGGIDPGESPRAAAERELFEETGIDAIRFLAEAPDWIYYDLPDAVLGIGLKGRYRGQRQRWFAFLFEGEDSQIDLGAPDSVPEFDAWRWEELSALPRLIVPFKRDAYQQMAAAFSAIPQMLRTGDPK